MYCSYEATRCTDRVWWQQKWLALSVPEGTTSELTGPLERLGERFLGVCKRQRLANGDDVNGQLTMRDFAQAGE